MATKSGDTQRGKRKRANERRGGKGVKRPRDWDKAVSTAYLRILGASQKVAGEGSGISARQIRKWEASDWWPEAEAEARSRWLRHGDAATMRTLLNSVRDGDATTARWWAERTFDEFAPPSQRHVHTGKGGEPIEVELANAKARLLEKLTGAMPAAANDA